MVTLTGAVLWGGLVWGFGLDTRVAILESELPTVKEDVQETKQMVRDIHQHLLNK